MAAGILSERHYHYTWREGNTAELLPDGSRFFPDMLQAIADAQHYILLEIYLFESGQIANSFITALIEASARDIEVRVLLDDFGSRGLNNDDRERLHNSGVQLVFYNPLQRLTLRKNLFRDHRKLLLIDGVMAYTGGAGITDEFDTGVDMPAWRDLMLKIRGPVVHDWQDLFERNWMQWASSAQRLLTVDSRTPTHAGRCSGRVILNTPTRMEIRHSLVKRINSAEKRFWFATAYFLPSWKLRRLLRKAARKGVDVRLLLPGEYSDHPSVSHAGRRYYSGLLNHGVRIFEYQPRFLHSKMVLCDDWISIGSSNADRWNMRWNLEANQELISPGVAEELAALFEQDFADSVEIRLPDWHQRPAIRRLLEWFWGKVDRWIMRWLR